MRRIVQSNGDYICYRLSDNQIISSSMWYTNIKDMLGETEDGFISIVRPNINARIVAEVEDDDYNMAYLMEHYPEEFV